MASSNKPGTLFARGDDSAISVSPAGGSVLVFGRNKPEVDVCVGADDPYVSRRHGTITRDYSRWVLDNVGALPIRFPGSRLVLSGYQVELPVGRTPLFIVGPDREHLLEVRIAGHPPPSGRQNIYGAATRNRDAWPLAPVERLVLVCLAQRYLWDDPQPQPLSWPQVAAELCHLQPAENWTWRRAAHIVASVRKRLSPHVEGLLEDEVPPPVGNTLNHNLITALLLSTAIVKADLGLLGEEPG